MLAAGVLVGCGWGRARPGASFRTDPGAAAFVSEDDP